MTDARIAKWTRWIEGPTIHGDVMTMHLQRYAWQRVSAILQRHGALPDSYWWEFMLDTYMTTQAVAIRRQADVRKDSASLAKVLQQLSVRPSVVTRDFWLGLWGSEPDETIDAIDRAVALSTWADEFGGGEHLDPAIPKADLARLQSASESVKSYVDKYIAHAADRAREGVPAEAVLTMPELNDAIDVIGEAFKRYSLLFTAAGYVSLVPEIQHDWLAAFRQPWIRPGDGSPPEP